MIDIARRLNFQLYTGKPIRGDETRRFAEETEVYLNAGSIEARRGAIRFEVPLEEILRDDHDLYHRY